MTARLRIGVVLLFTDDFARALHFYRDVLGIAVRDADPGPRYRPLIDWAAFDTGAATLELFDRSIHPSPTGDGAGALAIGLHTADLERTVERLRDQGVLVGTGIIRRDWGSFAWVRDPDGNAVQLYAAGE